VLFPLLPDLRELGLGFLEQRGLYLLGKGVGDLEVPDRLDPVLEVADDLILADLLVVGSYCCEEVRGLVFQDVQVGIEVEGELVQTLYDALVLRLRLR